jgi:hypothetical protein
MQSRTNSRYDPRHEGRIHMIRLPAFGARRAATALVVLAALFHVQWLAACEFMPMAPDAQQSCCVEKPAGSSSHCQQPSGAHECVTPIAKAASGLKLPERTDGSDTAPDDPPAAVSLATFDFRVRVASPPGWREPADLADGRNLYLTSSRLRL